MAGYYISLRPKGLEELGRDLHITLAYLGKLDDQEVQAVKSKLALNYGRWRGFQANVNGMAVWIAGRSYFTVGLVDGWDIRYLYSNVAILVREAGVRYNDRYPFSPHVTLSESRTPVTAPLITKRWPFTADTLYLSRGDVHIPLTGENE